MLNVRNRKTTAFNDELSTQGIMYWLAFAKKRSKVCHKILKYQEIVKFSILKKDLIFKRKTCVLFLTRCVGH